MIKEVWTIALLTVYPGQATSISYVTPATPDDCERVEGDGLTRGGFPRQSQVCVEAPIWLLDPETWQMRSGHIYRKTGGKWKSWIAPADG